MAHHASDLLSFDELQRVAAYRGYTLASTRHSTSLIDCRTGKTAMRGAENVFGYLRAQADRRPADHFQDRKKGLYDSGVDATDGATMPRKRQPPRLCLDKKRKQWFVRDGQTFVRTSCAEGELAKAEQVLASYIAEKYRP